MGILVIEGGRPDGSDFVMGDHHRNPVARANGAAQRHVQALRVGDGYAVLGLTLEPVLSPNAEGEPEFCAVLSVVGGRESDLVPMVPVKMVLGELARIPLAALREKLAAAIDGPKAEELPGESQ
jgi:hypothetical protein